MRNRTKIFWGLAAVFLFALGIYYYPGSTESSRINIIETVEDARCLSFTGTSVDPEQGVYILGVDGETYEMPLTREIKGADPASYPALEEKVAGIIEQKFCLEDWAIKVDIEDGKYKNITIYNVEPLDP